MNKKIYTSTQVDIIKGLKDEFGWSIRKISQETGIPRSVVGRWTKDPKIWRENYRWNVPERTDLSPKRKKALKKFRKKVAGGKKKDPDKYKGLMIRYTEDGDFEAYSG
ncbi:MAG: hypothetical protein KAI81_04430 [Candidatus Marinimicrobia bacterium]|nr:hypothetical protein [Candidatus Neomarinimicrobiota bacterium]